MKTPTNHEDIQLCRMGAAQQRRQEKRHHEMEQLARLHLERAVRAIQEDFQIVESEARNIIRQVLEEK